MYRVHSSHDMNDHSCRLARLKDYLIKQPVIVLHHLFIGSFGFLVIVVSAGEIPQIDLCACIPKWMWIVYKIWSWMQRSLLGWSAMSVWSEFSTLRRFFASDINPWWWKQKHSLKYWKLIPYWHGWLPEKMSLTGLCCSTYGVVWVTACLGLYTSWSWVPRLFHSVVSSASWKWVSILLIAVHVCSSLESILHTVAMFQMKSSQLYVINGLVMLVTFFLCRVVMFPYVFYLYSQLVGLSYWEVRIPFRLGIFDIILLYCRPAKIAEIFHIICVQVKHLIFPASIFSKFSSRDQH